MKLRVITSYALRIPYVINCKRNFNNTLVFAREFCISSTNCKKWGVNKKHRDIKLNLYFQEMADPKVEEVLAPLRASVKEQVYFVYLQCILVLFRDDF